MCAYCDGAVEASGWDGEGMDRARADACMLSNVSFLLLGGDGATASEVIPAPSLPRAPNCSAVSIVCAEVPSLGWPRPSDP